MTLVIENNVIWQIIWRIDPTDEVMKIQEWKQNLLKIWMKLSLYKVVNKVVTQREIVRVISITWNIIGIERAVELCPINNSSIEESQIALEFESGDEFSNNLTAQDFKDLNTWVENNSEYIENIKSWEILLKNWIDTLSIETDSDDDWDWDENTLAKINVAWIELNWNTHNTAWGIPLINSSTWKLESSLIWSAETENLLIKWLVPDETNIQINWKDPVFLYRRWIIHTFTNIVEQTNVSNTWNLWSDSASFLLGQGFQVTWSYTWIQSVTFKIKKTGSPTDEIWCYIIDSDKSTILHTSSNTISPGTTAENHIFTFENTNGSLTPWTQYYFMCYRTWWSVNAYHNYIFSSHSNSYSNWSTARATQSFVSWTDYSNYDLYFSFIQIYQDATEDINKIYKTTEWTILWLYSWVTDSISSINLINKWIYEHYEDLNPNTHYYITSLWEITANSIWNTYIWKSIDIRKILVDISVRENIWLNVVWSSLDDKIYTYVAPKSWFYEVQFLYNHPYSNSNTIWKIVTAWKTYIWDLADNNQYKNMVNIIYCEWGTNIDIHLVLSNITYPWIAQSLQIKSL